MSLSPATPMNLKSFWSRTEGKFGIGAILLMSGGALFGLYVALPYLLSIVWGTLELVYAGAALAATIFVLTDKNIRSLVSNVFQLTMRWLAEAVVGIDPIGILENTVDRMEENNQKLGKAIEGCAGAKKAVENQIKKNNDAIQHAKSMVEQATRQLKMTNDPLLKQRYELAKAGQMQEAGRRMHSNEKLGQILAQTTKMYTMLGRWQNLAEFNIENTKAEVENAKQERKAILESYKGLGFAQRIIKGDPEQLKLMNQSLEFLAEDNANKLGAMEDFSRYSEKFLTNMDLETGASAADAEKMMADYESKLLSAGSAGQTVPMQMGRADAVPVPRSSKAVDGDYLNDILK
jgi:hypothetical protein